MVYIHDNGMAIHKHKNILRYIVIKCGNAGPYCNLLINQKLCINCLIVSNCFTSIIHVTLINYWWSSLIANY